MEYTKLITPDGFDSICQDIEDNKVEKVLVIINNLLKKGTVVFSTNTYESLKYLNEKIIYDRVQKIIKISGWKLPDIKKSNSLYKLQRRDK